MRKWQRRGKGERRKERRKRRRSAEREGRERRGLGKERKERRKGRTTGFAIKVAPPPHLFLLRTMDDECDARVVVRMVVPL